MNNNHKIKREEENNETEDINNINQESSSKSNNKKEKIGANTFEEDLRQRLEKEKHDAKDLCEKHDSYEVKWDGEYDTEEDRMKCKEQCRESFVFRNEEDVRQRQEKEENDANDLCEQHDSYEVKWDGERDTEEEKEICEAQRSESFAYCNAEGVRHRLKKDENDTDNPCEQHDSYEVKWDGECDTTKDKKRCKEQHREIFACCNDEGECQRLEKEENDADDSCEQHDEMKWDGEYDTEEEKEKCEEQYQESFAVCNDEEVRQRLEKEENDTHDLCEQHDSYEVTWDGERDHEEDNKTDEDQRRESFDLRNAKGVRQRLEKENKDGNDLCEQHDNYELKLDGERDSEEDKKQCEE